NPGVVGSNPTGSACYLNFQDNRDFSRGLKMCELSVYMKGEKESLMEGVVVLVTKGDKVLMEDILGRTKEATGRIVEVNITSQKAFLEPA
nr:CooT family nickel-binding protein [Methanothrix sp.]